MFQRFMEMDLEIHVLLWETFITASPFSQKNYGLFRSLYSDQSTKISIIKTEHLKSNDKLPEYTDDSLSSQMPRLCFSMIFFTLHLIKFMNTLMWSCILHNISLINIVLIQFFKSGCQG